MSSLRRVDSSLHPRAVRFGRIGAAAVKVRHLAQLRGLGLAQTVAAMSTRHTVTLTALELHLMVARGMTVTPTPIQPLALRTDGVAEVIGKVEH